MNHVKQKTIVAIFAHPDDETFGPGGTLLKLAKTNTIYMICVTNGDAKQASRKEEIKLGRIRKKELQASAKILGIKQIFFLGYRDGSLSNNLYHQIADAIRPILEKLQPDMLLTFDSHGVSGHTDHIVVSNVTSFLFYKMKSILILWYYCMSQRNRELHDNYFIYIPPGYKDEEISHIIDVTDVWEEKVRAMHCHKSQQHDVDRLLRIYANAPKAEYFLEIKNKIG